MNHIIINVFNKRLPLFGILTYLKKVYFIILGAKLFHSNFYKREIPIGNKYHISASCLVKIVQVKRNPKAIGWQFANQIQIHSLRNWIHTGKVNRWEIKQEQRFLAAKWKISFLSYLPIHFHFWCQIKLKWFKKRQIQNKFKSTFESIFYVFKQ